MTKEQETLLTKALPDWAVTQHPSKTYLSVINPMAVIDRLNEVFGISGWDFHVREVNFVSGHAVVHGTLIVADEGIHLEQFGGNDNKDVGDAYKGAATDALTKIASYLGIGASVYKGQGNVTIAQPVTVEEAFSMLRGADSKESLGAVWVSLPKEVKSDVEVESLKDELKAKYV